jgi:hypothetical protein
MLVERAGRDSCDGSHQDEKAFVVELRTQTGETTAVISKLGRQCRHEHCVETLCFLPPGSRAGPDSRDVPASCLRSPLERGRHARGEKAPTADDISLHRVEDRVEKPMIR